MGKKEVSKELVVGVFPDCLVSFCRGKDTQFNGFMHGPERLRDVDGLLWLSSKRDWGNRKYIYINLLHSYVWSDGIKKGTWEREREREKGLVSRLDQRQQMLQWIYIRQKLQLQQIHQFKLSKQSHPFPLPGYLPKTLRLSLLRNIPDQISPSISKRTWQINMRRKQSMLIYIKENCWFLPHSTDADGRTKRKTWAWSSKIKCNDESTLRIFQNGKQNAQVVSKCQRNPQVTKNREEQFKNRGSKTD